MLSPVISAFSRLFLSYYLYISYFFKIICFRMDFAFDGSLIVAECQPLTLRKLKIIDPVAISLISYQNLSSDR